MISKKKKLSNYIKNDEAAGWFRLGLFLCNLRILIMQMNSFRGKHCSLKHISDLTPFSEPLNSRSVVLFISTAHCHASEHLAEKQNKNMN